MSEITLTFLGVGNAFSKKYGNNCALVEVKNGDKIKRLLIDCGRTVPDDLASAGYTWSDIDAIFITHLHGDHIYGLEEAGFTGRYVLNKKPHLIFPDKKMKNDLWEKVLKGTMMNGDLDRNMSFDDYFTYGVVDHKEAYFLFNDTMFSVYPTYHVKNKKSYGLIIGEENYVIYTADSLINKDLINLAVDDGCAAIFHDCQFIHTENRVHASLEDLATFDENVRSRILIMHYADDIYTYYNHIKDLGLQIALRNKRYHYSV